MASDTADPALRLRAEDEEDLKVISACLQDSLVLVGDLAYFPDDESFVLLANRFLWERGKPRPKRGHERALAAVVFGKVESVSYRGFKKGDRERLLSLLAVCCENAPENAPGEAPGNAAILLEFSAGAVVRLGVRGIDCRVRDLSEPWPTPWRPAHGIGEGA